MGKAFARDPQADGVYVEDEAGISVAVKDPSQVKSATSNSGAFNRDKDSILESSARDESLDSVAADSTDIPKPERESERPSRRPGESQRDYARRVMRTGKEAIRAATAIAKNQQAITRQTFRAILAKRERNI